MSIEQLTLSQVFQYFVVDMVTKSRCQYHICGYEFDLTVEFQRCSVCGIVPRKFRCVKSARFIGQKYFKMLQNYTENFCNTICFLFGSWLKFQYSNTVLVIRTISLYSNGLTI